MTSKILAGAVVVVAVFFGGFLVGRGSGPAVVQTKDAKSEILADHSSDTKKVDATKTVATAENKDVNKETTTTKYVDGRVVIVERIVDRTKTDTRAAETKIVVQEKIRYVDVVKTETHEKVVTHRPNWALGAQAGVSLPLMKFYGLSKSKVFGLSLERRIFGSVYAGINANTHGVLGVGVRVTF